MTKTNTDSSKNSLIIPYCTPKNTQSSYFPFIAIRGPKPINGTPETFAMTFSPLSPAKQSNCTTHWMGYASHGVMWKNPFLPVGDGRLFLAGHNWIQRTVFFGGVNSSKKMWKTNGFPRKIIYCGCSTSM